MVVIIYLLYYRAFSCGDICDKESLLSKILSDNLILQENQGQEGDPLEDQRELQTKRIVVVTTGDGHGVDSNNENNPESEFRKNLSARNDDTYRHFNTGMAINVPPETSLVDEVHVQGIDPAFLSRHSEDPDLCESTQAHVESTSLLEAGANMASIIILISE